MNGVDDFMEDPSWKATGDAALREIKSKRMTIEETAGLSYRQGLADGLERAESILERRGFGE